MIRIFFGLLAFLLPWVSWANISLDSSQKQGFENFSKNDNGYTLVCKKQCVIVLPTLSVNEFLKISGTFSGEGEVGYGFFDGKQVVPGEFIQIHSEGNIIDKNLLFEKLSYYSQIPKTIQVLFVVSGNIEAKGMNLNMNIFTPIERIGERFHEVFQYIPFSPRSINFLEGPTWGGVYINKVFFWWIILFLFIALFWSFYDTRPYQNIKRSVRFGIGILVFFWIFFDILHTTNQIKIYNDFRSAGNIMENGRLGRNSDFYAFLDFAKTIIPHKEQGAFISPYPFLIEGKYHSYPDIKFDEVDKVKFLIWYNPYGDNAPFGYKNPTISSGVLQYGSGTYALEKEVAWKDYAKIYILK